MRDVNAAASQMETLEAATKPFAEKRMDRGIREALRGVDVEALEGG